MFKFYLNIKDNEGITLIEIVVVISIMMLFSIILISDFPKMQKQFALSRATYKLAQDLRKTEDLSLSGVQTYDKNKTEIVVRGYGVYISNTPTSEYIIYADVPLDPTYPNSPSDQKYSGGTPYVYCNTIDQTSRPRKEDCVIEKIDISNVSNGGHPSLEISKIDNIISTSTSINFSPPDPTIKINNLSPSKSEVGINLSNGLSNRRVSVNTSGLIDVQ